MQKIKLVIFDLDGTLVDAYKAINSSFNYAMRSLGYPVIEASIIRRAVGWGDKNLLKSFVKAGDLNSALALYRRRHRIDLARGCRLLPGVKQVLTVLSAKKYKLAVASNRPTEFSWIIIRSLGLEKYFDYVLCADKLKFGKPHPQILQKITRKLKVNAEETLYVGDMFIDAQAGRRAKIKTVIVTTGSSTKKEVKPEHPYRIIPKIKGLLSILHFP